MQYLINIIIVFFILPALAVEGITPSPTQNYTSSILNAEEEAESVASETQGQIISLIDLPENAKNALVHNSAYLLPQKGDEFFAVKYGDSYHIYSSNENRGTSERVGIISPNNTFGATSTKISNNLILTSYNEEKPQVKSLQKYVNAHPENKHGNFFIYPGVSTVGQTIKLSDVPEEIRKIYKKMIIDSSKQFYKGDAKQFLKEALGPKVKVQYSIESFSKPASSDNPLKVTFILETGEKISLHTSKALNKLYRFESNTSKVRDLRDIPANIKHPNHSSRVVKDGVVSDFVVALPTKKNMGKSFDLQLAPPNIINQYFQVIEQRITDYAMSPEVAQRFRKDARNKNVTFMYVGNKAEFKLKNNDGTSTSIAVPIRKVKQVTSLLPDTTPSKANIGKTFDLDHAPKELKYKYIEVLKQKIKDSDMPQEVAKKFFAQALGGNTEFTYYGDKFADFNIKNLDGTTSTIRVKFDKNFFDRKHLEKSSPVYKFKSLKEKADFLKKHNFIYTEQFYNPDTRMLTWIFTNKKDNVTVSLKASQASDFMNYLSKQEPKVTCAKDNVIKNLSTPTSKSEKAMHIVKNNLPNQRLIERAKRLGLVIHSIAHVGTHNPSSTVRFARSRRAKPDRNLFDEQSSSYRFSSHSVIKQANKDLLG